MTHKQKCCRQGESTQVFWSCDAERDAKMAKRSRIVEFTKEDENAIRSAARSVLGTSGIMEDEIPDIMQELRITLFRKSNLFRSRKTQWKKFRGAILDQKIKNLLRSRTQPSARFFFNADISLDTTYGELDNASEESTSLVECVNQDGDLSQGTEKDAYSWADMKIDMALFIEKLPADLAQVCRLLMFHSVSETAKILKVNRKTIQRRMDLIKRGMIDAGFEASFERKCRTRRANSCIR